MIGCVRWGPTSSAVIHGKTDALGETKAEMAEERGSGGIADGIRTGIGILAAVRAAIEETLEEAVSRGDLSPERARSAVRDVTERVQTSLSGARERIDLVSRKELDALRAEVADLRSRIDQLEGQASGSYGDTSGNAGSETRADQGRGPGQDVTQGGISLGGIDDIPVD